MTEFITGRELWGRISALCAGAGSRTVAVAYLGADAPALLPLAEGDLLVTNASEDAIRQGSTSVAALSSYCASRVRVFNASDLHAKVYVFGDHAVVGSANVSRRSADVLTEGAAILADPLFVRDVRAFVEQLAVDQVTPAYLRECRRWARESAAERARLPVSRRVRPATMRVWLLYTEDVEYDTTPAHDRRAQKQVRNPASFVSEHVLWRNPPKLTLHDKVVVVHERSRGAPQVWPPARVIEFGRTANDDAIVYLEMPRNPRLVRVDAISPVLKRAFGSSKVPLQRRVPQAHIADLLKPWLAGVSLTAASHRGKPLSRGVA